MTQSEPTEYKPQLSEKWRILLTTLYSQTFNPIQKCVISTHHHGKQISGLTFGGDVKASAMYHLLQPTGALILFFIRFSSTIGLLQKIVSHFYFAERFLQHIFDHFQTAETHLQHKIDHFFFAERFLQHKMDHFQVAEGLLKKYLPVSKPPKGFYNLFLAISKTPKP